MRLVTKTIVLREVAYKESDKILTLLTEERGRLTASARGSRKKGGGVSAASQLLVWSEMTLSEHNGRWTVSEASTEQEFRRVRSDLERLALGSYFAEVTELLCEENVPEEGLLSLLLNALYAMEATERPLALVKATFELYALCLSGYCPQVARCAVCAGEPVEPRFAPGAGVVCCAGCAKRLGGEPTLPLDGSSLAAIRYVVGSSPRKAFSYRLGEAAQRRMSRAMEGFLTSQLERGFSTLEFYHQLTGQSQAAGPVEETGLPEDYP